MVDWYSELAFAAGTAGAIAFVVTYSVITKWWRYPASRYVMTFAGVLTGIMVLGVARLIFGPYPGIWLIRPIAYTSLAAVIWGAEIALVRVQLAKRTKAKREG